MRAKVRIALLLFVVAASCAGDWIVAEVSAQESSVSAKQVSHLLEEHYRHLKTLRAVFLERYNEGPKQSRVESGTVYFRRPGQMRWEYESPEKKLFVTDGKTVWFYVPYDHTVTKAALRESSDWRAPLALLTGKADLARLCGVVELIEQNGIPPGHSTFASRAASIWSTASETGKAIFRLPKICFIFKFPSESRSSTDPAWQQGLPKTKIGGHK